MSTQPTTTGMMAITQKITDGTRSLHFATDQGAVVIRIEDYETLQTFDEMMCDEAEEWKEEN